MLPDLPDLPDLQALARKHAATGILVDTNILLLWVVGRAGPELIPSFKRTQIFNSADYDLLSGLFRYFHQIIVTPHILTEVSNFLNQFKGEHRPRVLSSFKGLVEGSDERSLPAKLLTQNQHFDELGLADTCTVNIAAGSVLVLTADFALARRLAAAGLDAVNFNHLRDAAWLRA